VGRDGSGGRCLSRGAHVANGQVIDLGGDLIDTGHARIRALAGELGIALDDLLDGDSDHDVWFFDGRAISEAELVRAFVPVAAAIERDLASAGDGAYDHTDNNPAFRALDAMSIAQWFDRNGVTGWLRKRLDGAGIRHRVIAISACYAGGLIDDLGDPDTLVLAAARRDRTSFGCGNDSVATYFGRAWLVDGLNDTLDFSAAFDQARLAIATRERAEETRA